MNFKKVMIYDHRKVALPKKYCDLLELKKGSSLRCYFINGSIVLDSVPNKYRKIRRKQNFQVEKAIGIKIKDYCPFCKK